MLGWRLLMSGLLIPAFVALFYVDAKLGAAAPLLLALCLLLAWRCVWELSQLLRPRFPRVQPVMCGLCVAALLVAAWWPHWFAGPRDSLSAIGPVCLAYALVVLGLLAFEAARYRSPGAVMETVGAHLLIVSYIGLLLATTAQLRWVAGAEAGYLTIASLVVAAKLGDVGAYTFGRLFGRRKMAPLLSPGKTWAGFLGAVAGAALGGWTWLQFATPLFNSAWQPPAWYWSVLFGMLIGVAGLVGDLCESLIKRDMQQKDAAALMPGFGGLLDLLDSILYAGPVAYVLWLVLPLSTWR
jgi:phosphatidate cytidylyltransferase